MLNGMRHEPASASGNSRRVSRSGRTPEPTVQHAFDEPIPGSPERLTVRMKEDGFRAALLARACLMPWGVFRRFLAGNVHVQASLQSRHGLLPGGLLMFTGIIEGVGRVAALEARGGDVRLRIDVGTLPFESVQLGESIAVNGVCLTVVNFDAASFEADASNETLSLTTLGKLKTGAAVNLERAMRPTDRLGGHLVSGHVDGVGRVLSIHEDARAQRWRFAAPAALLRYVARKGSICVDGVSLTVNDVDGEGFEVALIPHTVSHTAFAQTHVGDAVNLEIDLVARYVERLLAGTAEESRA
jgi:riboflavin synthase